MRLIGRPGALLVAGLACLPAAAVEPPQIVCTITINSADEKEAIRGQLPAGRYRFVELVQRGRPDWLDAACRAELRCDVLIVSAHYDGSDAFYADRIGQAEHLTGSDLERASCSGACRPLFAQLREVYLFGCNTLNPGPRSDAPAEVLRSLVRAGHTPAQARQELQSLAGVHAESRSDRMRQIFQGAGVVYGFAGAAPLGPVAGAALREHLRHGGDRDFGTGRVSSRLLAAFTSFGLAAAPGPVDEPGLAEARADMCQFADERISAAGKLAFVHGLLRRHVGEARLYMDRIRGLMASLDDADRQRSAVAARLDAIARDSDARARLLAYARLTDRPSVRVQLLDLAHDIGWLDGGQRRAELTLMLDELQQRPALGVPEVHLACGLNRDGLLDGALRVPAGGAQPADDAAHAAVRACLGSIDDRTRTLQALTGPREAELRAARAYLRHRPLTDAEELRRLVERIAGMTPGEAQAQALEALSRHRVADRQAVQRLSRLFADSPSAAVQSAIAGILIRADPDAIDTEALTRTLLAGRHPAPDGGVLIELLLDTLQSR